MLLRRALYLILLLASPLAAQSRVPGDFTLRPGDVLELFHWRDELLQGEFPVEADGQVALPILGRWQVTETRWPLLRDSLVAAYARELRAGDLRIIPKRRVFVLGFVRQPGIQLADPTTSIAAAIAMAGGAAQDGSLDRVRVLRDGAVIADKVGIESPLVAADLRSGDQIYVGRRSWFDRNSAFLVSAVVGLAGIAVTLIVSQ